MPGTFKTGTISTTCQSCPEGSTSLSGSSGCSCSAGSFWDGAKCKKCLHDTASREGAVQCTACSIGSTQNKTSCSCPEGHVWIWKIGSGSCFPCRKNTYKSGRMSTCEPCSTSSTSPPGAAHCTCQLGTFWSNGACKVCDQNSYFDPRAKVCTLCPDGTLPILNHTACSCASGEHWHPETGACIPCPANYYSKNSALECTMCPLYTVSTVGSATCQPCKIGQYWTNFTCSMCNEVDEVGNGVFCVKPNEGAGNVAQIHGSSPKLFHASIKTIIIFSAIIGLLGILCIILVACLVKKQKKKKETVSVTEPGRQTNAMIPNVEYSEWSETAGTSGERAGQGEEARSWCGEWSMNDPHSSEENIYSYLDGERPLQMREYSNANAI